MHEQLPLFRSRTDASFANFVVTTANAASMHALQQWLQQSAGGAFYLFGADGVGRSHLLQAACRDAVAIYLPLTELKNENPAEVCEGLEQADIVCLDDIDAVLADHAWCEQLFHLYNRLLAADKKLLVSAQTAAAALQCALPDLQSRLSWGTVFRLHSLDDAGTAHALKVRAHERGFDLADEVIAYILSRHARDMDALLALLHSLDLYSLAEHKRITIPLVRRFWSAHGVSAEQ